MYRVEGTDNVFRLICENGIATAAELRQGWAWTNDQRYYEWIDWNDTIFTNPIPMLKSVCWYDPFLKVKYVNPGSYSLFLRHGLEVRSNFPENTSFTVKLFLKNKDSGTNLLEKQIQ